MTRRTRFKILVVLRLPTLESNFATLKFVLIMFYVFRNEAFVFFANRNDNGETLKKKSVSCQPGETKNNHPGGREIIFVLVSSRDLSAYNGENRLKIGQKMTEILKKKKKNAAG